MNYSNVAFLKHSVNTAIDSASLHGAAKPTRHQQLVEQTRKWVATTFFGPMLKQMRESPFKSELFSGGRGGEAYSALFDQRLSEHMTSGAGNKLVDSIVRKIEARQAYAKQHIATSGVAMRGAAMPGAASPSRVNLEREGADRFGTAQTDPPARRGKE